MGQHVKTLCILCSLCPLSWLLFTLPTISEKKLLFIPRWNEALASSSALHLGEEVCYNGAKNCRRRTTSVHHFKGRNEHYANDSRSLCHSRRAFHQSPGLD